MAKAFISFLVILCFEISTIWSDPYTTPAPSLVCGPNEIESCSRPGCPDEWANCDEALKHLFPPCLPPELDDPCAPKCICPRSEFVRIGKDCVHRDTCCPPNQIVVRNGTACPETCNGPPKPGCILISNVAYQCTCKKGYVKNESGDCILKAKCSSLVCGPNEVKKCIFRYCPYEWNGCQEAFNAFLPPCRHPLPDEICEDTCVCPRDQFVRIGKKCVQRDICCSNPTSETVVRNGSPCPDTCDGPAAPGCVLNFNSQYQCTCRKGFVKNKLGKCILKSACKKYPYMY